ncbi:MAG: UDP-N-acetylmuramoyl-L-alanine--D-glutamate ligase [Pseudomonadales bacterium]|nr:UDP-N-acetylmuramoyl-L-alanine--D-glutamate ligase [Pseudomonadales bacterium]
MQLIASDKKHIVVGLGKTGLSCVRYLKRQNAWVEVVDTRDLPPGLTELQSEFPDVVVHRGPLEVDVLKTAADLVVSPGVALAEPAIQAAIEQGVEITGDIDLFSCVAEAPILAITGSNGKTTVTSLLAEMGRKSGTKIAVGGNIGTPALDLLDPSVELYILELSSFQLETTRRLGAFAATVLNVSPDHMDRYDSLAHYHHAKHRIFRGCQHPVVNDDEPLSAPLMAQGMESVHFGLSNPGLKKFSTIHELNGDQEVVWLSYGFDKLLNVDELKIKGRHNWSNALAALAIGHTAGLPLSVMVETLREFPGLPHRCEWVAEHNGVDFINDSKGTNVGATCTAIDSIGGLTSGKLILIAGGVGKDADFALMEKLVAKYVKCLVLIGHDAEKIRSALSEVVPCIDASDLPDAVTIAAQKATPGDTVLLSPACASFDMFDSYEHRGTVFRDQVKVLQSILTDDQ